MGVWGGAGIWGGGDLGQHMSTLPSCLQPLFPVGEAQGLAQEHRQDQLVQPRGVVVGRRVPALSYPLPLSHKPPSPTHCLYHTGHVKQCWPFL